LIVNAFSVVAVFAAVLRTALGIAVLAGGIRAMRRAREAEGDRRFHLLLLSCATLAGLALVSSPLLYLVLESYVGAGWPGVMCVQGVTRIGTGSLGPASWLPVLLGILAVTKPLLVFVSGAWLVLHLIDRRGGPRVVKALALAGLLAVADGAAETAYLLIPKQEKFLAAGCCTAEPVAAVPEAPSDRMTLKAAAFVGVGSAVVLALTLAIRLKGPWLGVALALAVASLPTGLLFLRDVAAPRFLHLPYHHCVFCLVRRMPETLVGIALYVTGAFGVGWALLCRTGGGTGEGLLRAARFGYLGALVMAAVMEWSS
jgi:hypothetical protein